MENLQTIWFIIWSFFWIVYFTLDGFDFGCGMVLNFISKNDNEKRAIINTIGPFWDGNEVWLITAGALTFAAFPVAYAYMFSWLYTPLFLILLALILRGVSFELRGKMKNKKIWDTFIFLGSFLPALLFGIAFGNFWEGLEIGKNGYTKGTIGLLNFFGILTGLLFVSLFIMHSLLWLLNKIEGDFKDRIFKIAKLSWFFSIFILTLFIIYMPLTKNIQDPLLNHYIMMIFYALSLIFITFVKKFLDRNKNKLAFYFSMLTLISFLSGSFSGVYPNIMPSNISSEFNVSIFNSSSGFYTLKLMLIFVFIFIPIIVLYQIFIYKTLHSKINAEDEKSLHY